MKEKDTEKGEEGKILWIYRDKITAYMFSPMQHLPLESLKRLWPNARTEL